MRRRIFDLRYPFGNPQECARARHGDWTIVDRTARAIRNALTRDRITLLKKLSHALGVLGPIYINYGRAISTVRYVSGLMTEALENIYDTAKTGDDQPEE